MFQVDLESIVKIHHTVSKDLKYVSAKGSIDQYLKFIQGLVKDKDYSKAISKTGDIDCLYYSLKCFYKIKVDFKIEVFFFYGKYYPMTKNKFSKNQSFMFYLLLSIFTIKISLDTLFGMILQQIQFLYFSVNLNLFLEKIMLI
jgi:hypothetical protein